jgi:hypothetical protein
MQNQNHYQMHLQRVGWRGEDIFVMYTEGLITRNQRMPLTITKKLTTGYRTASKRRQVLDLRGAVIVDRWCLLARRRLKSVAVRESQSDVAYLKVNIKNARLRATRTVSYLYPTFAACPWTEHTLFWHHWVASTESGRGELRSIQKRRPVLLLHL